MSGDARNGTAFSAVAPSQRPAFATHQSNMSGMAFIPPEYPHGNARPLDWFRSGLQRILLGIFGLIRARPFAREEGGTRYQPLLVHGAHDPIALDRLTSSCRSSIAGPCRA
jgi:hypothetical protein